MPTIKAEHINPFIASTIETFSTMCTLKVKPGTPNLRKEMYTPYDISGIIGLSGDLQGSLALGFHKATIFKIVHKFVGVTYELLSEEVRDAVGELANIISGNAKKGLGNHKIDISLPTIILGASHRVTNNKDIMTMVVPFTSEIGGFDMILFLKIT